MAKPGGPHPRQPLYMEIAVAAIAESLNSRKPTSLVAVGKQVQWPLLASQCEAIDVHNRNILTGAHSELASFNRRDERQPLSGEKILLNSSGLMKLGRLPTCTVDTIAVGVTQMEFLCCRDLAVGALKPWVNKFLGASTKPMCISILVLAYQ